MSRTGYTFDGWNKSFNNISGNTTITAQWTANLNTMYTVQYYLQNIGNDDYTWKEEYYLTGETDTIATATIKTYEHFVYNATNSIISSNIAPDGSLVLKVYYDREKHTVTFDANGGTLVSGNTTQKVKYGGNAIAPTFSRDGYTFTGWDKAFISIGEDITVKAQWSINTYTVTYILNGGTNHAKNPAEYTIESTAITLLNPTKEHYVFDGWTYNGNPVTSIDPSWNDDVILIANWKVKAYVITYELNGGSASNPTTHGIDSEEITLIAPARNGYKFEGWTGSNGSTPQMSVTIPAGNTENLSYTANWSIVTYTITYNLNGGQITEGANPTTYTYVDTVKLVSPNDRNGYHFAGWYIGDTKVTSFKNYYQNLTITAKWEKIFTVSGNGITGLTDYGKTLSSITIPDTIDGYSIKYIGEAAFLGCSKLTSIVIPKTVTSIGISAFEECTKLKTVTFEEGSGLTSIGSFAFYNCYYLTKIDVPATVTTFGTSVFYQCRNLSSITVPFIGPNLNGSLNGTNYEFIGYFFGASTFSEHVKLVPSGLKTVVITNDTNIGDHAFYGCSNLSSVTIPDSVVSIDSYAFCECSNILSVTIPDSVESIGESAFERCSKLKSIVIGDSVTSIGESAFSSCSALESIVIPASVTYIGDNVLVSCKALTSITVESGNKVYKSVGNCLIGTSSKILIAGCKNSVIPTNGSVTSIGSYAFFGCDGLTSITIPSTVKSIEEYAFAYCGNLKTLIIYSGVTSIPKAAFIGCKKLTTVSIPTSVTTIGEDAFYGCSGLTSMVIPQSVTEIGFSAFEGCSSLTSITIPFVGARLNRSDTSFSSPTDAHFGYIFGASASNYNKSYVPTSLSTVKITGGNTILSSAFQGCSNIDSVTIDGVKLIESGAFSNCTGLDNVTIGSSVLRIGNGAFSNCSSLYYAYFYRPYWYVSTNGYTGGKSIDVSDSVTAATYLKSNYSNYYWSYSSH